MTNGMFTLMQGVDEDDGVLNDRNIGWVWYSSAVAGLDNRWMHEIAFPANGEGQRPLYAGLALLGFEEQTHSLRPSYYLQVFDGDNQPLSTTDYLIPRAVVPDGTEQASSLGDQFVGFYSERGICRILVGNTLRIDHLQFGMTIPEPGAAGLLLGTLLIGLRCRRRCFGASAVQVCPCVEGMGCLRVASSAGSGPGRGGGIRTPESQGGHPSLHQK